jgi:UDP-N-acetyl-D-mannosaminuronic acid dehydrogenase
VAHKIPPPHITLFGEARGSTDRRAGASRDPIPRRVVVIGLGYIGLPTAATLAAHGVEVVGVDVNPRAVELVNRGKIHLVEPDLEDLVHDVVSQGKLRATTRPEPADAFIVAVGTPCREGHRPDVSYIEAAAHHLASVLRPGNLVILESTSPVGTTEQLAGWLAESRPDLTFPQSHGEAADIQLAHCPERVLPGRILHELIYNDRVIGGLTPRCAARTASLYRTFVQGACRLTHARTAEMAKLTENAFRDVNIAFANELSLICDRLGIDVWELIEVANCHPRVNILQPGPGVGGHCIAVDPWFIVHAAPDEARLIRTAREVNDHKPEHVIDQIRAAAEGVSRPVIACLGLAFKADIDDLRESPSVEIARRLAVSSGARVLAVEPHVQQLPRELAAVGVELVDLDRALAEAHVVALLVNHQAFHAVEPRQLAGKAVIDTRGMWRGQMTAPAAALRVA